LIVHLKEENRYHEDIFGITLRTDEVLVKLRELKKLKDDNDNNLTPKELASLRMGFILTREAGLKQRTASESQEIPLGNVDYSKKGRDRKLSTPLPYRSRPLQSY
jgi:hypothetical protein